MTMTTDAPVSVVVPPALEVSVSAPDLLAALKAIKPAVPRYQGSLPTLFGVRIDAGDGAMIVTATDLDLHAARVIPAEVAWPGSTLLPFKLLHEILNKVKSKEQVRFEVAAETPEETVVSVGLIRASLRAMPLDEYPVCRYTFTKSFPLDLAAVADVIGAASKDQARPILTGTLFKGSEIVCTDSYRLFVQRLSEDVYPAEGILVPAEALNVFVKHKFDGSARLELSECEQAVRVVLGDTSFIARTIPGDFPNYQALLPATLPNVAFVDKNAMSAAIRQVAILAKEATPIRLEFRPGQPLRLTCTTQDIGTAEAELDIEYDGVECTVAFNPDFLLDNLAGGDDTAELAFIDALKPGWVIRRRPEGDHIRLLMPVRVS